VTVLVDDTENIIAVKYGTDVSDSTYLLLTGIYNTLPKRCKRRVSIRLWSLPSSVMWLGLLWQVGSSETYIDTCLPNYTSSHRIIQCQRSYRIQIMRLANLTDVVSGYPSIQTCRGVSLEEDLTPYQSSCRLYVSPSSVVLSFRDRSEVQTKQATWYKGK